MKFARDILFIDMQTTGINVEKDFPLQISAVLLDKDNLLEKGAFSSYIKNPFSQTTNDRVVQALGIPREVLIKSPNLKTVLTAFKEKFSYNVTIASHNIVNVNFLRESFRRSNIEYEYDYHVLELWTLAYMYLSKQNLKKIPTAETIGSYFKLSRKNERDSLESCRYYSEIFRQLVKRY